MAVAQRTMPRCGEVPARKRNITARRARLPVLGASSAIRAFACSSVRSSRYKALCMALTAAMRSGVKPRRRRPSKFIERACGGLALAHDERRQVGKQQRTHGGHAVRADAHKLVHDGEAAEDDPVADLHMAGQLRVVGENRVVADLAVVRQVHVGHDPVVVAHPGHAGVAGRADVEGAELADRVAVADDQFAGLARVLLVLRDRAERVELENAVVAADGRVALDHAMRADGRAGARPSRADR